MLCYIVPIYDTKILNTSQGSKTILGYIKSKIWNVVRSDCKVGFAYDSWGFGLIFLGPLQTLNILFN